VEENQAHWTLTASCIRLMSASLKEDRCGVDAPGVRATELGLQEQPRINNSYAQGLLTQLSLSPLCPFLCAGYVVHGYVPDYGYVSPPPAELVPSPSIYSAPTALQ
jgi:hypothetical protein